MTTAHYHCPYECEHPQPFTLAAVQPKPEHQQYAGKTFCGRCYFKAAYLALKRTREDAELCCDTFLKVVAPSEGRNCARFRVMLAAVAACLVLQ
jgi:hypothetical protein